MSWKERAREFSERAKDAADKGADLAKEKLAERATTGSIYGRVSEILTLGDDKTPISPERLATLLVHAVRKEDQENLRTKDVIEAATKRQRLIGLASLPAGPIGLYVSSLYCEAALLCHVEQLHRLGLSDQQLAGHLLTLWHVMPDYSQAEAAVLGTGPSVLNYQASKAKEFVSGIDLSGNGMKKSDVIKFIWRLRGGARQGVSGSVDGVPGSLSPKDVLLPRGRVKEVIRAAEKQFGVS